jgi:ribonuclease R
MKLTQENIIKVLEVVARQGATTKEMLAALAQKKRRKAQLRKILKELTRCKICKKHNNRYYLEAQPESSSALAKATKKKPPYRSGKSKKNLATLGLVLYRSPHPVIYSLGQQKEMKIARGSLNTALHGDLVRYSLVRGKQGENEADIAELIERRITCLKGSVHSEKKGRLIFVPDNPHGPKQYRVHNSVDVKKDEQLAAWLDVSKQALNNRSAEGSVRLIPPGMPQSSPILSDILATNKIPKHFPESVINACRSLPNSVRYEKSSQREDLRELPFVTIDGEDAKDFDDAIYAVQEGQNYRIWVSIADVADYVSPGTAIDREAFCRGTSTYLPGLVFPMLPETLSNGLCSLKEGLNRKTVTNECLIDKRGKTIFSRVYPSLCRIACRLTYPAVDGLYESGTIKTRKGFPKMQEQLLLYREISFLLRKRRIKAGFIDFQLPETGFKYDRENRIIGLVKSHQSVAMQVIEQFMLLANENVAVFCEQHKLPIVWRNHSQPLPEKLKRLQNLLWNNKIKVSSLATGKDFNQVMELIKTVPEKDFLEYAMLRSMSLAVYETKRAGHFGIASEYYCHFTSPIRRYPDLLVHRALKNFFKDRQAQPIPDYVAATSSDRERLATGAERAATRFFKLYFLADRIGELFAAKICGFINAGIFVEIESPYVEGFVHFSTIRDDHYEFDEEHQCILGRENHTRFTIGKKLTVLLTRLDWGNLSPEFDWICWNDAL